MYLYNDYSAVNEGNSNLPHHSFYTIRLQNIDFLKDCKENVCALSTEYSGYSYKKTVTLVLNSLVKCEYLTKELGAYALTEKAFDYVKNNLEASESSKPDTQTGSSWQDNILQYFIITCVTGIIIGISVLYCWHYLKPPK